VSSADTDSITSVGIPSHQERTGVTSTNISLSRCQSTSKITYTSGDLHALRPASHKISRSTRKVIFSCGIWKPKQPDTSNSVSKISTITTGPPRGRGGSTGVKTSIPSD
jgi:hypothetical protein